MFMAMKFVDSKLLYGMKVLIYIVVTIIFIFLILEVVVACLSLCEIINLSSEVLNMVLLG
jgi:hypothetical protein